MVDGLAKEFSKYGHSVEIVTTSVADDQKTRKFRVTRGASAWQVWQAVRTANVVVLNQFGFRFAWPLLFLKRKTYVVHHAGLPPISGRRALISWIRKFASGQFKNVAISQFVQNSLPFSSCKIFSAYRDDVFCTLEEERSIDLGFSGRIVSSKGLSVLVEALEILKNRGLTPSLYVMGEGSQWAEIKQKIEAAGLTSQVTYGGPKTPEELNEIMNQVKVMVVPSTYEEPLGLVPVEALACGCAVVASDAGGLSEAVGPAGVLVPPSDPEALALACQELLGSLEKRQELLKLAPEQCLQFGVSTVAKEYLALFSSKGKEARDG